MTVYVQYRWVNNEDDLQYPVIETLWDDDNATISYASQENNYRISHAWRDAGLSFKIQNDYIAVINIEQVYNTMYVDIEYVLELENSDEDLGQE